MLRPCPSERLRLRFSARWILTVAADCRRYGPARIPYEHVKRWYAKHRFTGQLVQADSEYALEHQLGMIEGSRPSADLRPAAEDRHA